MRKPAFCICENKDADQLRGSREADQSLCFRYTDSTIPLLLVRTKKQKSRLVLTVPAFCEEKGLRSLSGVVGYAESKNQCWQFEKWLFIDLICIFSRWPPKTMELVLHR